ncbi:MAG: DUF3187 family protein [Pseudomonadota bacterium]
MKTWPSTVLVASLLTPLSTLAVQPFYSGDMSPFTMHYGAPLSAIPQGLDQGQWRSHLGYSVSNTLHIQDRGSESLRLDGESSRVLLALDYGLSQRWDMRLELPWVSHGAGNLDGFVDDFHGAFGFPEGQRPNVSDDQYRVFYRKDGVTYMDRTEESSGIGDASVSLMRSLETDYEDELSVGIKLKLPSGDEDELTGSGTTDLALWLTGSNRIADGWQHYASVGGVYMEGDDGPLADLRRDGYGFASYGIEWRLNNTVSFKLQADAQTAVYHSDTRLLGHSASLTSGGTLNFSPCYALDIGVTEDVDVGTSPDVVFLLNLIVRDDSCRSQ